MEKFIPVFLNYLIDILPALAVGFFLSGLIHEFIPGRLIEKALGQKGPAPIFYATIVGTILPICCWGSLPLAVSFYKKGSRLGPILAFLVATPATSVTALLVSFRLLGIRFVLFEFFAVIVMGLVIGLIANRLAFTPQETFQEACAHCDAKGVHKHNLAFAIRVKSALKFSFYDLPKEIGMEIFIGIILASVIASIVPIGEWIKLRLAGLRGYLFALAFSLLVYICATGTVPLVEAFIRQGLGAGAAMVLLLAGPITSYGTILVLRKKFGLKILFFYLGSISILSLILGYIFTLFLP